MAAFRSATADSGSILARDGSSPPVMTLRRLTGLFVALLLFQANWQESGAACVTGHATSHHEAGRSTSLSAGGGAATAHGAMAGEVIASEAMAHDGPLLRRASDDAGSAWGASSTGPEQTPPSHCPDSGIPAGCAAMMACSNAAVSNVVGPLLATEGRQATERVAAPDARPLSRDSAPDVPPPRA